MNCDLQQLFLSCVILCLVKVCASLGTQEEGSASDHGIVKRQAIGNSYVDEGFDLDPKRDNNWNQFPAWGKRLSKRRWSSLGAWGKRSWLDRLISANNNWGKRWKSMSNSWGKRQVPMEYDGLSDENINLKKRSVNSKSNHISRKKRSISPTETTSDQSEEKRRWSSLSAWGKRSDDLEKRRWSSLSAWGKRSYDDLSDSDDISKRKWSSFSSWGKRGLPAEISKRLNSYWRERLMLNTPWIERRGWNALTTWGKRSMA